jgi:hypothetical protein
MDKLSLSVRTHSAIKQYLVNPFFPHSKLILSDVAYSHAADARRYVLNWRNTKSRKYCSIVYEHRDQ